MKLGTKLEDDFLVVDIRPLKQVLGEYQNLTPIEKFTSWDQRDFEMCVLLEDSFGDRLFGLVKFLKFKKWDLIPEIGNRYRIFGVIEQFISGYRSSEFAYLGFRILKIEE